ncbi:phosphoribosylglycinamide formyltransferase [Nitrospirillum amazonense]|uniref:Phosphoribosylglycinamide formyltransferase n=1 Tax=Nitrospirillum amazonense TaxID=28077 RepID=A0A560K3I8_9PROT|nr:phosphoribosylglycinamide formyltransferase [Nitrospirillum amazonense]MDG3444014.1 phosphoribosylglycinamide formyltransferase [Nitrospirillum amazonense]TWB77569.1 phosphoribosylglycinamide formyltransferase-1 [Nitrospirillum amazonense]
MALLNSGTPGRLKLGVLISGRGSNLQALLNATTAPDFPATVALVLSNKADAAGLERARGAGIPALALPHKDYADKPAFEQAMTHALEDAGVQLVCLAGFMRLLSPWFVDHWRDRLINIHPSLLPAFPGIDTHQRALDAGVRFHGCTVHYVRSEVDSGPIVAQAAVPVQADDTADTLSARVLTAEHELYPLAVRLIAEGRVSVEGNRAVLSGPLPLPAIALNPTV